MKKILHSGIISFLIILFIQLGVIASLIFWLNEYREYILDNYGDLIGPATDIYHYDMSKEEQTTFYSELLGELGVDGADNLLKIMFGISLEDAKDKVEN